MEKKLKVLGVIPARYESKRFPGKVLAKIYNKPMIEWVYSGAKRSNIDKIVIATDDLRVESMALNFTQDIEKSSKKYQNGTERVADVSKKYNDYDIVLNIQCDEPLIDYNNINFLIKKMLQNEKIQFATLKYKISEKEDLENPNIVKVITDIKDNAIYFSRHLIPFQRNEYNDYYKHIGIYAYRFKALKKYTTMKNKKLETAESLEQLRILENGYKIKVFEALSNPHGVDSPEDIQIIKNILSGRKK